jgi:cell division septal protein FtsQ
MYQGARKSNDYKQKRFLQAEKKYSNPFFKPKKRRSHVIGSKSIFSLKVKLISAAVLSSVALLVWLFLYSHVFTIEYIEARGEGRLNPMGVEAIAWQQLDDSDFLLWPQKNIFIFDKQELKDTLNLKYSFNDIIVSKKLPDKLIVQYKEKEHSLIWQEKGIYFYTDNHGFIVERIGDKRGEKDYPLIVNDSSYFIDNNRVGIRQELIDNVFVLIDKLKGNETFKIDHFLVDDNSTTLKLKLKDAPFLYFNISADIDKQINKLMTLKNEILKEDFNKKEYIDVRTGDRVYYK